MMKHAPDGRTERGPFRVKFDALPADLDTPVSAYLKLRGLGAAFLLESAEGVDRLGRFSFIGFKSGRLFQQGNGLIFFPDDEADPLSVIKEIVAALKIESTGELPGLLGAAVGFIGFDYVRRIENLPLILPRESRSPLCEFVFVDSLVVFDHLTRTMSVYSLIGQENDDSSQRHEEVVAALKAPFSYPVGEAVRSPLEYRANMQDEEYRDMVSRAKQYIHAGDIFQVVLSRRQEADCRADAFEVYRSLRMSNPSPYMFYLDFGRRKIAGSSPEVLVRLQGRQAQISPIAGTRPRGTAPPEDQALEAELLADEKERAEHIMLVDLARNDIGRVSRFGSVRVEGFMRIERYSHVMHIVSDVYGELSQDRDQYDLFRASFPAGTVSGAPKVRALEIIEELEKTPRGIYAGAVGYFSPRGDMDTCIAIRTLVIEDEQAVLQAGAGIVADSDPRRELMETENKLAALKLALETARKEKP